MEDCKMNVLVTGGAGYIGSTLVPMLLAKGFQVRVLDNLMYGGESLLGVWGDADFEFLRGDIRDRKTVRFALDGIDAIVHLAAIVGDPACARQPTLSQSVNLDASLALVEESKIAGGLRFIFASTCSNYGKMKSTSGFLDESAELRPVSEYAEQKVAVERAILDSSRTEGLCCTSLRLATVYGVSPRMRFDLLVNDFTLALLAAKRLQVYGENFWRPYIHVRDVARAICVGLQAPKEVVGNEVFNVGSTDQNYRKRDVVEKIAKYVDDHNIDYVYKQEDPRDYRVSFKKIKDILGFTPTKTVEEGIEEIVKLIGAEVITDFSKAEYRN